jgi:hypothetical protein
MIGRAFFVSQTRRLSIMEVLRANFRPDYSPSKLETTVRCASLGH